MKRKKTLILFVPVVLDEGQESPAISLCVEWGMKALYLASAKFLLCLLGWPWAVGRPHQHDFLSDPDLRKATWPSWAQGFLIDPLCF